jgi:hypothetical protein
MSSNPAALMHLIKAANNERLAIHNIYTYFCTAAAIY